MIKKLLYLRNRLLVKRYEGGTWLQIQQPSKDDFKILSSEKPIITRLDLALDIETENSLIKANKLSKVLKVKYTRKGYGAHKKKTINEITTYFRASKVSRNVVVYGGRVSKVTGCECVHIELRLKGARTITRNGINFEALITGSVDIEKLFRKALKIVRNNKNGHNFDNLSPLLQVLENIGVKGDL